MDIAMKTCLRLLIIALATGLAAQASAEVYRWTDANGKVHYSDTKPKDKADNITADVKKQNIDTSSKEHEKLGNILRKENQADRDFELSKNQPNSEQLAACAKAKDYLRVVQGRVYYIDEDGKTSTITEDERKKEAERMRVYVAENCSD